MWHNAFFHQKESIPDSILTAKAVKTSNAVEYALTTVVLPVGQANIFLHVIILIAHFVYLVFYQVRHKETRKVFAVKILRKFEMVSQKKLLQKSLLSVVCCQFIYYSEFSSVSFYCGTFWTQEFS